MSSTFEIERGWVDLLEGTLHGSGELLRLTPIEVAVLAALYDRAPDAVSRNDLLVEAWGYSPKAKSRTVPVTIQRLRSKIELDPSEPRAIVTVRGQGYALRVLEPDDAPVPDDAFTADPVTAESPVGRQEVLDTLAAVAREGHRIVTLVGPGGMGKTTVARHWRAETDAIWADLLGARDPATLKRRLRMALGVDDTIEDGETALRTGLTHADHLVLDNAEDLDEYATRVLGELLNEPGIAARVLVTSQRPLRIPGERRVLLPEIDARAARVLVNTARQRAGLPPASDAQIEALRTHVGGVPLALSMLAPMLDWLDAGAGALIETPGTADEAHHDTVAAAMRRSLEGVREDAVTTLLANRCFAGPATPVDLAHVAAIPLPACLAAVAELRERGLVRVSQGRIQGIALVNTLLGHTTGPLAQRRDACAGRHVAWVLDRPRTLPSLRALQRDLEQAFEVATGRALLEVALRLQDLLVQIGPMDDLPPLTQRVLSRLPAALQPHGAVLDAAARAHTGLGTVPVEVFETMVRNIPDTPSDRAWRVRGLGTLCVVQTWSGVREAVDVARELLELLERPGQLEAVDRIEGLQRAGFALGRNGHPDDATRLLDEATQLALTAEPGRAIEGLITRGWLQDLGVSGLERLEALLRQHADGLGRLQRTLCAAQIGLLWLDAGVQETGLSRLREQLEVLDPHHGVATVNLRIRLLTRLVLQPGLAEPLLAKIPEDYKDAQTTLLTALVRRDAAAVDACPDPALRTLGRAFLAGQPLPDVGDWPETRRGLQTARALPS